MVHSFLSNPWGIPQVIPNRTCLSCDVCCRFPEKDSFLAPFFTDEEVRMAKAHGVDGRYFKKKRSGRATQVELIPNGEGYICPAFNPKTRECKIYPVRPMECQLYPFVVMESRQRFELLLGIDQKCPFFEEHGVNKDIRSAVHGLLSQLEGEKLSELFQKYPELVGPFQEDVRVIQRLPRLSSKLLPPKRPSLFEYVKPLGIENLSLLKAFLNVFPCMLSSWAPSAIFLWQDFFRYYWAIFEGCFCLFAESDGYLFMPLPPLGKKRQEKAAVESLEFMREINGGASVTRIENIPELFLPLYRKMGLDIYEKPHEYVYDRETLKLLQGDRYKSKRSDYNYFTHHHSYTLEALTKDHSEACIDLFLVWKRQKEQKYKDIFQHGLLQDAYYMHKRAFALWEALDLQGKVVRVDGQVKAYTFGVPLGEDGFCIQAEVQDPHLKGIATFIFREFCRSLEGYSWINTMDDSGLENLRVAKRSYRPIFRLPSFIARLKD